ncbi:MAG TPA: YihY/virulence factor BrkB family protein, partial [Gemmatimonadales bacterium]|nr:YihY/virulence factor BrkB family protein [Gemmatimonadales bacterium]
MDTTSADRQNGVFPIIKQSVKDFVDDDAPTMAAALSYYTVFALPPLLILLLMLLGAFLDPQDIQGTVESQIRGLMGPQGAEQIRTIIANADRPGSGNVIATILGIIGLVLGATGVFGQLQAALNRAWEVGPDPNAGGVKSFIGKRIFSLGMVLALAFVLLASLLLSAVLTAFGDQLGRFLPEGVGETLLQILNFVVSFGVITLLFAAMFKVLPDATIAWRDVWVGAAATAFLFTVGKFALGLYLGRSNPGQAFGAAGALALMLVWIYYTSMILLLGAEFTQVWADRRGQGITPEKGAVRVVQETRRELPAAGRP